MFLHNISSIQTPPGSPEFVKLEDSLKCMICHRVLRDAMQTTCGHRICEECVPKMFDGQQEPVDCPLKEEDCLKQKRSDITPDPSGRREVRKIRMYCTYKDLGCHIKPPMWKDLEPHVQQCEYRPVECPNKQYGCIDLIPYLKVQAHVDTYCQYRLVPCQYCKQMIPLIKTEEDHVRNECKAATMICPYKCGIKTMKRENLNRHMEFCTKKPKECKFKTVGCRFTGTETDVAVHISRHVHAHLDLVNVYTVNLDVQSMQVRQELQEGSTERDSLRKIIETQTKHLTMMTAQLEEINNVNKELKRHINQLERRYEDMDKKDVGSRLDRDVGAHQTSPYPGGEDQE